MEQYNQLILEKKYKSCFRYNNTKTIMLFCYFIITVFFFLIANKTLIMLNIFFGLLIVFDLVKISYFTVLSFLNVFTLFQEYYHDVIGIATGMLKTGTEAPNAFYELSFCTSAFLIAEIFFIINTDMIKIEKKLYRKEMFNYKLSIIFRLMSLVITLLIFPSIPTFRTNTGHRFDSGIIPFSGFAGLSFFLLAISFNSKMKKRYYLLDAFCVFWFVGHAERIEAMGYLCYVLLRYFNKMENENLNIGRLIKKYYKIILVILAGLIFMVWIGLVRGGDKVDFEFSFLVQRLFIQSTACDVAYVFNCTVDLSKNGQLLLGKTYLGHISNLVPFFPNNYDISEVIMENYYTVGGCPFFGEIVANFGVIGVIPVMAIYFYFNYIILKTNSKYRFLFWVPISMMAFRTAWYGWTSWYTLSFIVVPILYLLNKYILQHLMIPRIKITE